MNLFGSTLPLLSDSLDSRSVEVGLRFSTTVPITAHGVRFYKESTNTGTHTGSIWNNAGQRLATVTFTGESTRGWQSATFATPLTLPAGTYTVSYLAPRGHVSTTALYFATKFTDGTVTAATSNGRHRYGAGGVMPSSTTTLRNNYFVDLIYSRP